MRDKIKRYQYVCRTVFSLFCFIATLVSITQSFGSVSAVEGSASANASVTVSSACSFSRTNGSGEYNGILANNSSVEIIGSTFTTFCNDPGGYAVYAIGYSNNEYGNTDLIYNNEPTSANNIKTNGDTTGSGNSNNGSSWKMKLVPVENNFTPTIENNYSSYNNIPSTYTKVASYNNVTANDSDSTTGSSITTHYQATASSTQPAGTYAGTVKYTMVHPGATPAPTIDDIIYLQDFDDLASADKNNIISSMKPETNYTKLDRRDDQEYTIAKLKDGKVWMTENLNLAGGTEITSRLSDMPEDYILPTANGFQEGNKLPESSQTGFSDNTQAYVYNTGNDTNNCANPGCYSYYSWLAATIGSLKSTVKGGSDAPASICPAGWKMPNSRSPDSPAYQSTDFYQLAVAYGATENQNTTYTNTFYDEAGTVTIPNFLLAGAYDVSRHWNGNSNGAYWSSTSDSLFYGFNFGFGSTFVSIWNYTSRRAGLPVRCLVR